LQDEKMKEKLAALLVMVVVVAVPCSILWYQYIYLPSQFPPDVKVFNITAVGEGSGAYTLEEVNGLNYWWKRFAPMTLLLHVGDRVALILRSADVSHSFYIPDLNVGPIDIVPGHVAHVEFIAYKVGAFQYFCTTLCGECHCYMTGWIVITSEGEAQKAPSHIACPACFVDYGRPPEGDMIDLGDYLYLSMTCNACHGWEGRGGVKNPNYAKKTIPAHNSTAEKLFLRDKEDADTFTALLVKHADLDQLEEPPDIAMFNVVSARYKALKDIVKKGSRPEKLDPVGPEPPLWMPAWKYKLTEREIDALVIYFIDLYPWEEEEEEEDDDDDDNNEDKDVV
jgi:hypothetical protein